MQTQLPVASATPANSVVSAAALPLSDAPADAGSHVIQMEETLTANVSLPHTLDNPAFTSAGEDVQDEWRLNLHSERCFDCNGFNPGGARIATKLKCYATTYCPATTLVVSLCGKKNNALSAMREAQQSGDPALVAETMAMVNATESLSDADKLWIFQQAGVMGAPREPEPALVRTSFPTP